MNVKTAKKPQKRIESNFWLTYKIQTFGNDNLYPQNIMQIVGASGTAVLCLSRYEKFIEGYGFDNEELSKMKVSRMGSTMDDLLKSVADDLSKFGGFALHCNYNVFGKVAEVNHIPFEQCRLEEVDDAGYVGHIKVHPDWKGEKTRNGKRIFLNRDTVVSFPVFNPEPSVVMAQIEAAGGIDNYKGQILWVSMAGPFQYPTPIFDAVVTEISTDEGLGNIKYRNVRNNFLVSCMMVAKKGAPRMNEDTGEYEERQMISDEDLKQFQGDTKGGKILYVELESDEDEPKIVQFPARNFDKEFSTTDTSVIERIYAQFHQELFYAIRIGKLGFSGQVMQDAYEYYAGEVTTEQRFIERAFSRVFSNWYEPIVGDFSIQPLKYISAENNNSNE